MINEMKELMSKINPANLQWIEGNLPDVHSVPYDSRVLVWKVHCNVTKYVDAPDGSTMCVPVPELEGKFKNIAIAYPWKDDLDPLRWCDGGMPLGYEDKVKFYAWLHQR